MYAELFDFKAQLCLAFEYTAGKEWNRREVAVKVILIDAFSQIFRCYFAITHLTNADGEPTNAVFGTNLFGELVFGKGFEVDTLEKDNITQIILTCPTIY